MVKDEFSHAKGHAAWFVQRAAHPLRDAHPDHLEQCWALRRKCQPSDTELDWQCMGPFNIAGRVNALIADPGDPNRLYAGAAAGGVWRSEDRGGHWKSCWPQWMNPNIGALAFDPGNARTIYCATGEGNLSPDSYPGSGLYVTHDGGDHWKVLADAGATGLPRRIGALCPDPYRPGRILLGGIYHEESDPAGLYWSDDGGVTWQREDFFSRNPYWCNAVVTHPDGSIYAALNLSGAQSGVWHKGASGWRRLGNGMKTGDHMGRISLAIAPSNPEVIYALVGERHGKLVLDVYRSRNGGRSWDAIGGTEFGEDKQSIYNNTIAVHPEHCEIVACGLRDVHVSRDGGDNWVRASVWDADESEPVHVHADQHALLMPGGDLLYTATDGGVYVSEDLGGSWSPRANRMCNVMFYDVDVAPADGRVMCAGAQDNGTVVTGVGDGKPGDWTKVLRGDGAWTVFHPTDPAHVFSSTSAIHIFRHTAARHWGDSYWHTVTPKDLKTEEHREVSIAVMAIDPAHPNTVWVGSRRLWRTIDDGDTWEPASPAFDGSAITAIEIPPAAPEQVWVGTRAGGIFRSLDSGATWSFDLSGPEIPQRLISRIETHPRTARRLVVTVAGTGLVPRMKSIYRARNAVGAWTADHGTPQHVFYSEDAGLSWRGIQSAEMPDVAYHAAVFETHEPYRLFVANDCGVWMTRDLAKWENVSGSLPTVMVNDLVYHHRDRALIVATHGRGVWRAEVPATE